jgi:hypothetical protein
MPGFHPPFWFVVWLGQQDFKGFLGYSNMQQSLGTTVLHSTNIFSRTGYKICGPSEKNENIGPYIQNFSEFQDGTSRSLKHSEHRPMKPILASSLPLISSGSVSHTRLQWQRTHTVGKGN